MGHTFRGKLCHNMERLRTIVLTVPNQNRQTKCVYGSPLTVWRPPELNAQCVLQKTIAAQHIRVCIRATIGRAQ
jgi:hypothetical protein